MVAQVYTRSGEWSEVKVDASQKGWLVKQNSRISGKTSGWRVFLPYDRDFPRGCDLNKSWDSYGDYFGALAVRAADCLIMRDTRDRYHARILSRGHEVR